MEQLHYTWTPRGVEGVNRFQIAAISPGLMKGAMAALLPTIRKICQYDTRPDRSSALYGDLAPKPISFGWFDHRDYRIAFSRVGLPAAKGKVGNFAAHAIAGPIAALPERELALRFGSSLWWIGPTTSDLAEIDAGRRDFALPRIELADYEPTAYDGSPDDSQAGDTLAYAFLTLPASSKLTVTGDSHAFGRGLLSVSHRCPEALEGLSLSTYEGTPTFPFRVVGALNPRPGHMVCVLDEAPRLDSASHDTFVRLCGDTPEGRSLRAIATAGLDGLDADRRRSGFWEAARGLVSVATAAESTDEEFLRILRAPNAIAYVASEPPGRRRIATALYASVTGVAVALNQSQPSIADSDLTEIYANAARCFLESHDLRGSGPVSSLMRDFASAEGCAFQDALLSMALEDPQAAATLMTGDLAILVVRAAERDIDVTVLSPLLQLAARDGKHFASDERVPAKYLSAMFRLMLRRDPLEPDLLADLLISQRSLLDGLELDDDEQERCLALLEVLRESRLERALEELLLHVARADRVGRISKILGQLPARVGAQLLASQAGDYGYGVPASLNELCDDCAANLLNEAAASDRRWARDLTELPLGLLRLSGSADASLTYELLSNLQLYPRERLDSFARRTTEIENTRLRSALLRCAVGLAIASVRRESDVAAIWRDLLEEGHELGVEHALRSLLAQATRDAGADRNAYVLGWIALDLLPQRPELLTKHVGLCNDDIQALCVVIAGQLSVGRLARFHTDIAETPKATRAWWGTLEAGPRDKDGKGRWVLGRTTHS